MKSKRFYVVKKPLTKSGSSSVKLINILQGDAFVTIIRFISETCVTKKNNKNKIKTKQTNKNSIVCTVVKIPQKSRNCDIVLHSR